MTTNYMCNEWLDQADLRLFEEMRIHRPNRYKVAGLGNWGVIDGLVYENWEESNFDLEEVKKYQGIKSAFGLDFGYTNDPTAFICMLVHEKEKEIYVFDEMYKHAMSNEEIAEKIIDAGFGKEKIIADNNEPKSIARLRTLGLTRVQRARKGKDSINNGIDYIQDFKMYIHPKCVKKRNIKCLGLILN